MEESPVSFSRDVRNQLAQLPVEKTCCQHSQLLALTIASASEARSVNGQPHLVFLIDNAAVARHLFKLGKAIFHQPPLVTSRHGTGHLMHQVAIPVGESGRLPASLRLDELQEAICKKSCCRRTFLRGIFMGCGSIVSPTKAYHLEINATEDVARWVVDLLAQEEVAAKCYHR
jgi:DNA-binding protein WhiA